jgi:hypothetical protein
MRFGRPLNRDPKAIVEDMSLPEEFTDCPVYFAEIFDPAHFWCHIAYAPDLDQIKVNYDVFHRKFNKEYKELKKRDLMFSKENIKRGLLVAGYFEEFNAWYRVKVLRYSARRDMARVYCIDYGTRGTLRRKELKYLFCEYLQYPKFCFRARVFGIKPPLGFRYFDPRNVEKFIAAISSKRFFATLIRHDETENVYEMTFRRSTDDMDMIEYIKSENIGTEIPLEEYPSAMCLGPMCYILPTFAMIETTYPTFVELLEMQNQGYNYNLQIDTNNFLSILCDNIREREDLMSIIDRPELKFVRRFFFGAGEEEEEEQVADIL